MSRPGIHEFNECEANDTYLYGPNENLAEWTLTEY